MGDGFVEVDGDVLRGAGGFFEGAEGFDDEV